jgi:hypothetical protein
MLPPSDVGRPFLLGIMTLILSLVIVAVLGMAVAVVCPSFLANHEEGPVEQVRAIAVMVCIYGPMAGLTWWLTILPVYCFATGCRYPLTRLAYFLAMGGASMLGISLLGAAVGGTVEIVEPNMFLTHFPDANIEGSPFRFALALGGISGALPGFLAAVVVTIIGIIRGWRSLLRRARDAGPDGVLVR